MQDEWRAKKVVCSAPLVADGSAELAGEPSLANANGDGREEAIIITIRVLLSARSNTRRYAFLQSALQKQLKSNKRKVEGIAKQQK